jgi:hypothetical protein
MATPNTLPAAYPTLLDIAKKNGSDYNLAGLIDETTKLTPEVRLGSTRTIKGQSYKQYVRTSLPTSPFRYANQGTPISKAAYEERVVECFILNPQWECDIAVADKDEDGPESFIALAADAQMKAAIQALGRSFFYGRHIWSPTVGGVVTVQGGGSAAFPGLADLYNPAYEYDAGGTANDIPVVNSAPAYGTVPSGAESPAGNAFGFTSVYGVKWGLQNVCWVWGQNGEMKVEDVQKVRAQDSAGNPLMVYHQGLLAYPGLQLGDQRSVVRIKNIAFPNAAASNTSGHPLTDAILSDALALLPAGIMPDAWFMSRAARTSLRNSRTAVNITGEPAPMPDESYGIPIYETDSISNYEPQNFLAK